MTLARDQALRGALATGGWGVGGGGVKGRRACGTLSTKLSDFRQSARSGNERECKQKIEKHVEDGTVISANQYFASIFLMQIQETQLQGLLLFPSPPPERSGELARRLR